jgi:hypothetical protein
MLRSLGSTESNVKDNNGHYIVHAGELFCRAAIADGPLLCGVRLYIILLSIYSTFIQCKYNLRTALAHHLCKAHPNYVLYPAPIGGLSTQRGHVALAYFQRVMEVHNQHTEARPDSTPTSAS